MTDPVGTAAKAVGVIAQVAAIAGESPEMRQVGTKLAKSALTVAEAIDNALLPLAAVNFGIKKAKVYFQERFAQELQPHISKIPPSSLIEPKASVAGPAMQGIAYAHEEQPLKEMFLRLIAQAMDARTAESAHPAFVEIIRQLDANEAVALGQIAKITPLTIAEIQFQVFDKKQGMTLMPASFSVFKRHVIFCADDVTGEPTIEPEMPLRIDNWIRLGLIDVDYSNALVRPGAYDWVKLRPEFKDAEALASNGQTVGIVKGILTLTDFGSRFARVVGLIE